jgi:hypothetical protein
VSRVHIFDEIIKLLNLIGKMKLMQFSQITKPNWIQVRQHIRAYGLKVREVIESGWSGYLMTFLFNSLSGSQVKMNREMKSEIEGVYGSFLTRSIRRPHSIGARKPVLIACPDWPVPKKQKKSLSEIRTNGGLHHHGILLVAPADRHHRLKVPIEQHFADQQAYYTREQYLKSVEAIPFSAKDSDKVTDYVLKGLKTGRIDEEEALLILPTTYRTRRPYIRADE